MQHLATIPSPAEGVWHLGPLPLRAYALMIILGIVVAVWLGERRWIARGGTPGVIIDVAIWAVPFGLLGGRLYHVITDYQRYFGEGREPIRALQIWNGGLGIWGAVALGALGAWIGCRRRGISVAALGDAIAPGVALAQGIGRWGNWWNQELFGRPLDTWWALEIDRDHRPDEYVEFATFHPTFLYEFLWCVGVALLVIWAGKRFNLTHGRTFALYVAAYTVGRFWIEWLRIDDAHEIMGLRLNDWVSLIVFAGAVAYLWWARNKTGPERVTVADAAPAAPAATETTETTEAAGTAAPAGGDDTDREPADDDPVTDESLPAEERPAADPDPETPRPEPVAESAEPADDPEPRPERDVDERADEQADEPRDDEAKDDEPTAEEPKAEAPVAAGPTVEEPKAAEPEAANPEVEEPVAEEPAADKPGTGGKPVRDGAER
jgi:phosphatidylglycerol---prolipoprotein diacylglyceryl transferase